MQKIELQSGAANAHQSFTVTLGERDITFRLDWMPYQFIPKWNLNLYEGDTPLVLGLILAVGCDLLEAYHLGIGKLVLVGDEPTLENLGTNNSLVLVGEDEEI